MKKTILFSLLFLFIGLFAFNSLAQTAMMGDKDKYGGTLKLVSNKRAGTFGYPPEIRFASGRYAMMPLQGLLGPGKGGDPVPILATSWELASDNSKYTFKLRKGVKFHDGSDFNAQAVKWNLDNILNSRSPILSGVKSVDVIDDYTVQLNLESWTNLILHDLTGPQCYLISPTSFKKHDKKWAETHPIGTGPFKLKAYKRGLYVKYEKFDGYWEKGLPYLDGFEFNIIVNPMTAYATLKAKEVDVMMDLDMISGRELRKEENYKVEWIPGVNSLIAVNTKDPKSLFADKRLREAIEYAIDKESICKNLGHGFMNPIYKIINKGPDVPDKVERKYNLEKAKQLMAEAGYPNGFKTAMIMLEFLPRDTMGALQDQLAKVGIELEMQYMSPPTYRKLLLEGGIGDRMMVGVVPGGVFPLYEANMALSSKTPVRADVRRTPGFDDLMEQAMQEKDMGRVTSLVQKMEKLAYDDAMLIPLWPEPMILGYNAIVKDAEWYLHGTPAWDLKRAWLSEK
ncbi:ABC transporter substrate-binding protein [Thermodesulfobacteriota bacterium]